MCNSYFNPVHKQGKKFLSVTESKSLRVVIEKEIEGIFIEQSLKASIKSKSSAAGTTHIKQEKQLPHSAGT